MTAQNQLGKAAITWRQPGTNLEPPLKQLGTELVLAPCELWVSALVNLEPTHIENHLKERALG